MRTTTYTKRLRSDRHAISAFLSDLRNDPAWRQEILSSELRSGEAGQAGARYVETVSTQGIKTQVPLVVSEVVPGSRLVVEARDLTYDSRYEYQFLPVDGGTEVTVFMSMEMVGGLKLAEPLIWTQITHWVERDLARLDEAIAGLQTELTAAEPLQPENLYEAHGESSRAFLGEVVDSLAEGVMLATNQGRAFYANRAAEEILGVPREALLGRRIDDPSFTFTTLDGQPIPVGDIPLIRVLRTGRPVLGSEYRVALRGRGELTLSENAVPLVVEGRTVGAALTFTDIAERVETEARLKESEERFRAILDQSVYGITISSADGAVLVYNPAMERLTGISQAEVTERGWLVASFPNPTERKAAADAVERAQRGESVYTEAPFTRRDGRRIWVSYSSGPIRLHGKDYVFTIASDITQRAEAQAQVRFQSRLLEEVRNAVLATDPAGRIVFANKEAVSMFGQEREKLLGAQVMSLLRPRAAEGVNVMQQVGAGGQWEGEACFTRLDGSEVPVLLSLGQLTDERGQPSGYVSVAHDISDIKAAEASLAEKDRDIRQAYVDVIGAVTGGRLVLVTREELMEALGQPLTEERPLVPGDLSTCRHDVVDVMEDAGVAADPSTAVVALGEAATNALKHAGGGTYQLFTRDGMLQVEVADEGPGIDFTNLPKATLVSGYSSVATLGMGFTIMLDLADRILLATEPGHTEVVLEFARA